MGLSNDVIKNLYGILRFNNLATTAISIGLLSNALIACNDISTKAREELHELQRIVAGSKDCTEDSLILEASKKFNKELVDEWQKTFTLEEREGLPPISLQVFVSFPAIIHPGVNPSQRRSILGDEEDYIEYPHMYEFLQIPSCV